jgi:Tol biopolymer transport system component
MRRHIRLISLISMLLLFSIQNSNAEDHQLPLIGPVVAVSAHTGDAIQLFDLGTGEVRNLSFSVSHHQVWGFSPDGCRVMFTLSAGGEGLPQLYTANLDGTDVQAMVRYDESPAGTWGAWEPVWSVQNRIAFTLIEQLPSSNDAPRFSYRLATINGTTANAPTLYTERLNKPMSPQWSPDGIWLAYVRYQDRVPGTDLLSTAVPTNPPPPDVTPIAPPLISEGDLWVMSVDGQDHYSLTDFPVGSIRNPLWSPDGTLISFIYSPTPQNDLFYMIANQQGALATQLNFEWESVYHTVWQPNGSSLISTMRGFRDVNWGIWSIPLIGNADEGASPFLDFAEDFDLVAFPQFSADGQYLAFTHHYNLHVLDLATHTWKVSQPTLTTSSAPVWTPANFAGETACY